MRHSRVKPRVVLAAGVAAALAGALLAQDERTLPVTGRATVMVLNALPPGTVKVDIGAGGAVTRTGPAIRSALLSMTIDRWSTDEEKSTLGQVLKSGGTYAFISALEGMTVGYLHVNGGLRWPIRVASTWNTAEGQVVRLATNGQLPFGGSARASGSTDYPISIFEFTLPPTGRGEGSLVAATRVGFDDQGRIEVRSMPLESGTQRLTNVEIESPGTGGN